MTKLLFNRKYLAAIAAANAASGDTVTAVRNIFDILGASIHEETQDGSIFRFDDGREVALLPFEDDYVVRFKNVKGQTFQFRITKKKHLRRSAF